VEDVNIPAEIWRRTHKEVKKLWITDKELVSLEVDPHWETADVDTNNNHFPRVIQPSRLEAFKYKSPSRSTKVWRDIMQDSKTELTSEEE
jgi:hypothetical protein